MKDTIQAILSNAMMNKLVNHFKATYDGKTLDVRDIEYFVEVEINDTYKHSAYGTIEEFVTELVEYSLKQIDWKKLGKDLEDKLKEVPYLTTRPKLKKIEEWISLFEYEVEQADIAESDIDTTHLHKLAWRLVELTKEEKVA